MSKNKYKPQVWVLPEDDANRQIAQGFTLEDTVKPRSIHVLPAAGGWTAIRDSFEHSLNGELLKYPACLMVLLVDFDDRGPKRADDVLSGVADEMRDRVFVLGARGEPERLKTGLGMSFERIGRALAKECIEEKREVWAHELLAHNRGELDRMVPRIRPILFP